MMERARGDVVGRNGDWQDPGINSDMREDGQRDG